MRESALPGVGGEVRSRAVGVLLGYGSVQLPEKRELYP